MLNDNFILSAIEGKKGDFEHSVCCLHDLCLSCCAKRGVESKHHWTRLLTYWVLISHKKRNWLK